MNMNIPLTFRCSTCSMMVTVFVLLLQTIIMTSTCNKKVN